MMTFQCSVIVLSRVDMAAGLAAPTYTLCKSTRIYVEAMDVPRCNNCEETATSL